MGTMTEVEAGSIKPRTDQCFDFFLGVTRRSKSSNNFDFSL
jgi:hypothetical protein